MDQGPEATAKKLITEPATSGRSDPNRAGETITKTLRYVVTAFAPPPDREGGAKQPQPPSDQTDQLAMQAFNARQALWNAESGLIAGIGVRIEEVEETSVGKWDTVSVEFEDVFVNELPPTFPEAYPPK